MTPLTPSELSIGNLLNYDTGEGIELTVIDWQDLKWMQESPESFNKSHTPVPLTPEILEGFGFVTYEHDDFLIRFKIKYGRITFLIKFYRNFSKLSKIIWHSGSSKLPIHAHTLQNFVQAISGVELVYKPNNTK